MTGSTKLGEYFGIPVRMHNTWYIAGLLIVLTLAVTLRGFYPWWENVILGIVASVLFFGSMCARVLAQYAVATNRHMPYRALRCTPSAACSASSSRIPDRLRR